MGTDYTRSSRSLHQSALRQNVPTHQQVSTLDLIGNSKHLNIFILKIGYATNICVKTLFSNSASNVY